MNQQTITDLDRVVQSIETKSLEQMTADLDAIVERYEPAAPTREEKAARVMEIVQKYNPNQRRDRNGRFAAGGGGGGGGKSKSGGGKSKSGGGKSKGPAPTRAKQSGGGGKSAPQSFKQQKQALTAKLMAKDKDKWGSAAEKREHWESRAHEILSSRAYAKAKRQRQAGGFSTGGNAPASQNVSKKDKLAAERERRMADGKISSIRSSFGGRRNEGKEVKYGSRQEMLRDAWNRRQAARQAPRDSAAEAAFYRYGNGSREHIEASDDATSYVNRHGIQRKPKKLRP
jgi:hypothetical protein